MEEKNIFYIGDDNNPLIWDKSYVNELIETNQYDKAADYIDKFTASDAITRNKLIAKSNELKAAYNKNAAMIASAPVEERGAIQFAESILNPNAVTNLRKQKDTNGQKIYNDESFAKAYPDAVAFENYYRNLGSKINQKDNNTDVASRLTITFPKRKESLILGAGWLVRDRSDEDDFFRYLQTLKGGITREDLDKAGIEYRTDDITGDFEITFNKDDEYGRAITIAAAKVANNYWSSNNTPYVKGYDKNNNPIEPDLVPSIYRDPKHPYIDTKVIDQNNFKKLDEIYNKVSTSKTRLTENQKEKVENTHNSTVFSLPEMTNEAKKKLINGIKTLGFDTQNYKYYTEADPEIKDKVAKDSRLKQIEDKKTFNDFITELGLTADEHISLNGMIVNGVTGFLVTLDAKEHNGKIVRPRRQMFIPNLYNNLTSYQINTHSDLQAELEMANMREYKNNYKYRFDDGSSVYYDEIGRLRSVDKDGNIYDVFDEQEVLRSIDKDLIIKQAAMQQSQYLNNKGQFNMTNVRRDAALVAIAGADELYPDIPLVDIYDNPIQFGQLFDNNFMDDRKYLEKSDETCNAYVRRKLVEIYDLYDKIVGKAINKNK